MDPMNIDVSPGRLIAEASSRDDGRARWTELRVYYLDLARRCWVSEVRHTGDGEPDKVRRLASSVLERALRLFEDSDLGVIVKEAARETAQEEGLRVIQVGTHADNDRDALALLFGYSSADDVSIVAAAAAFGMGESTLRMALKAGRDIRVPLRVLLPFIDRASFQRAKAADHG